MASVLGKAGKQLSFGKRVFNAFMDWYIYACGYRQLGRLILLKLECVCVVEDSL